ncbi:MAG: SigE family RNA polymerase sigma factor [Actinomycetota bacterium]|nr:SigE family RNA polymerase sigma factor [Actinomycetota bacterium]
MTFEEYVSARLPALLGTARLISTDTALAEDLVQDVLIKLHARWDTIGQLVSRDAYVRRMLINELISWRRKWSRQIPHADPAGRASVSDRTSEVDERDALMAEVRQLPPRQRIVVVLRFFADLSDEQIAADLGCAVSTVRVHASRALRALRINTQTTLTRTDG